MLRDPAFLFWLAAIGLMVGAVIYRVIRFGGFAAALAKPLRERDLATILGEPSALEESKIVLRAVRHPRIPGPCVELELASKGVAVRRSLSIVLSRTSAAQLREALERVEPR